MRARPGWSRATPAVALLVVTITVVAGCGVGDAERSPAPASPGHAVPLRATLAPSRAAARTSAHPAATRVGVATAHPGVTAHPRARLLDRCRGNRAGQLVVVSLAAQHMWLCHGRRTVRTVPITSGRPTPATRTPTGNFRIQGRNRNSVLTPADGRTYDVRFWIPFDAPDFGFHDASWQRFPFGSPRYRSGGSHGCVHVPLRAIRFLYNWVSIGTRLRITAW